MGGAEPRASDSRPAAWRGTRESRGSTIGKKTVLRVRVNKWRKVAAWELCFWTSARKTVRSGLLAG